MKIYPSNVYNNILLTFICEWIRDWYEYNSDLAGCLQSSSHTLTLKFLTDLEGMHNNALVMNSNNKFIDQYNFDPFISVVAFVACFDAIFRDPIQTVRMMLIQLQGDLHAY